MLHGVEVAVVVPAYDEAPRIARVITALPASVDQIVVVDDASRDATSERAAAVDDPRVHVVRHERNRGVGAAIATGYRRAAELVDGPRAALVVMAGDGQMDPADLPAVVGPIARGKASYVKGNRFAWPGVASVMPAGRRLGGGALSWLTSRAVGQPITDSQCGYTALAHEAYAELDLDALWPRFGYPNDLIAQLVARGIPIAEVPVRPIYADEQSRLRPYHVAVIAGVIARAWARRAFRASRARARPAGYRLKRALSASHTTEGA